MADFEGSEKNGSVRSELVVEQASREGSGLDGFRARIDEIDDEILRLFIDRMDVSGLIAKYKDEHGIPTLDPARERQKLAAMGEKAGDGYRSYARMLYTSLFELSRAKQSSVRRGASDKTLGAAVVAASERTAKTFPRHAITACQGVEGSYSQQACERLFPEPNIMHFSSFDSVFSAVRDGLCQYGILPLENSTAGSVNMIYDLMMRYNFKIARSVRLKIDHNLLAREGVRREDVREIFTHEQAVQQCAGYLKAFGKGTKITTVANTAEAAKMVSDSGRGDVAAIASRACCELYGLKRLESSIQDRGANFTRFICISKDLEIYPGADRTSVMMTLEHRPGALYKALGRIYTLGVNVVKLESRPIPDRDFEFMFYFDLETSVHSENFGSLMGELESMCEEFHYLGSYSEIV